MLTRESSTGCVRGPERGGGCRGVLPPCGDNAFSLDEVLGAEDGPSDRGCSADLYVQVRSEFWQLIQLGLC